MKIAILSRNENLYSNPAALKRSVVSHVAMRLMLLTHYIATWISPVVALRCVTMVKSYQNTMRLFRVLAHQLLFMALRLRVNLK